MFYYDLKTYNKFMFIRKLVNLFITWKRQLNCHHSWILMYDIMPGKNGNNFVYCNKCWKEIKLPVKG